jgi:hypothetical protein
VTTPPLLCWRDGPRTTRRPVFGTELYHEKKRPQLQVQVHHIVKRVYFNFAFVIELLRILIRSDVIELWNKGCRDLDLWIRTTLFGKTRDRTDRCTTGITVGTINSITAL